MKSKQMERGLAAQARVVVGVLRKHRKDVNPTRIRYQWAHLTRDERALLSGIPSDVVYFDRFMVIVPEGSPAFRTLLRA